MKALIDEPSSPDQASGGLVLVKARAFGRNREFKLIGRVGYHVVGVAVDGGPATMTMLLPSDVLPESYPTLTAYLRSQPTGVAEVDAAR